MACWMHIAYFRVYFEKFAVIWKQNLTLKFNHSTVNCKWYWFYNALIICLWRPRLVLRLVTIPRLLSWCLVSQPRPTQPGHPCVSWRCESWRGSVGHQKEVDGEFCPTVIRTGSTQVAVYSASRLHDVTALLASQSETLADSKIERRMNPNAADLVCV